MVMAVRFPVSERKERNTAESIALVAITTCSRCSGLMVVEQRLEFPVWRCVQCGERVDPVILQNRRYNNNGPI